MWGMEQAFPAVGAVFGLCVCLFGGRFTRLYTFVLGCLMGTSITFWWFSAQLATRYAGVPLIVGLLVSLLSGVVCLLLHMFSLAGILGFTVASFIMLLDNGSFLTYYRSWVLLASVCAALYYTFSRPHSAKLVTTATSGALLVVLCADSWSSRSLGALLFQETFLDYTLGVDSGVARCFMWKCWVLVPTWIALAAMGLRVQQLSYKLRTYESRWPLLFQAPKRSNYTSSSRASRSPERDATESLVAEDRSYTLSNYASLESYQKLAQAASLANQQTAAAQAAQVAVAKGQPSAHPALGSNHADDRVQSAPVQRASFNYMEVKRLPQSQQYLYLVIHHAFVSLSQAFGFQADNMNNQYEHVLFLLSNFQNRAIPAPAATAAAAAAGAGVGVGADGVGSGTYQAGSVSPGTSAAAAAAPVGTASPSSDAISLLHARLFSNYREWIAYMSRGGNSTLGGSAISSSDVAPVLRSAIAEPRVDKNTTDAKIEEICLWLLVWGEAGSLRHAPECLLYIFHNLSTENRRFHKRFGGGLLEDVATAGAGGSGASSRVPQRPRRSPGDFLSYVVRPLYDVLVADSKSSAGRNYDDFNEFFWRTECFDYDYADPKYRVPEEAGAAASSGGGGGGGRGAVSEAARRARGGGDVEDPPALRSSIGVSQAVRTGQKSFLEKRSWLHPLRSFMRLVSFYGVCFHLLVCIAYIHYLRLPLLSVGANNILASFVISLAFWSLMREALELWATWGIVADSVWNGIGFFIRGAVKGSMFVLLLTFYTWSRENPHPVVSNSYADAYLVCACVYLLPTAISVLTQLFPRLGNRILGAHLPFADELLKFWYPIQKIYVGTDVHEPEGAIYAYQVFWALLLLWKMYASLLFQVSPLIQPTMDVLDHIDTLSISRHTYVRWLHYVQIAVLWIPFILVYLFDTIIWYFLWQAVVGLLVGMKAHLGEIRAFPALTKVFTLLPKQFDDKIVYNPKKGTSVAGGGLAGAVAAAKASGDSPAPKPTRSATSSPSLAPLPAHPRTNEATSLLSMGGDRSVSNSASGAFSAASSVVNAKVAESGGNLAQPLTMSRARRGSIGSSAAAAAAAATATSASVRADPFRNVAWENFAVVWNEVIEDLRLGDLVSNQERHMLRFRFDTSSVKEYYLPLFLMVGHMDSSIEHCQAAQAAWQQKAKQGGMDANEKARQENALMSYLMHEEPLRTECLSEIWEHVCWLLLNLLGERHAASLTLTFGKMSELFLTHHHVLRGTNMAALEKVKADLLNLVRGLRIASASFATLRLQEAAQRSAAERAREEQEELEREDALRAQLEAEAEAAEEEELRAAAAREGGDEDGAVHSEQDGEGGSDEDEEAQKVRASRKRLIQEAERSTQQKSSLARAREFNLKSMLKSPSVGTLNMLEQLSSRPRHRSAAFVSGSGSSTQPRPLGSGGSRSGSSTNLSITAEGVVIDQDPAGYLILHISLIRDQLSALLNSLAGVFNPKYQSEVDHVRSHNVPGGGGGAAPPPPNPHVVTEIIQAIKHVHITNEGFMWDGAYAGAQIHALLADARTNTVLTTMHSLLTVAAVDVEPRSAEAVRRLLFFANSLFMALPVAPSVRSMKSLSTLTPFHSEDVLYSFSDLQKTTEDGVSVFLYLQTIYPLEWQNFLQRCGIQEEEFNTQGSSILSNSRKHNLEARLWATMRGQTLGRTVDGMMLYEKALKLLLKLEEPDAVATLASGSRSTPPTSTNELEDHALLVQTKYTYVVSCQIYGKQKRENDPKALDIEFLLHRHPSLRVAYIDSVKVPYVDALRAPGQTRVREEFYSVLIKSERSALTGASDIKEVYRIQLPGNPVLGEGKPENQNHAIIFTRGEFLQAIDMNQSNYFEEALKMRNLLEEFTPQGSGGGPDARKVASGASADGGIVESDLPHPKRVSIVGFREHIYTGGLSSIAHFMALQEGTFVTQGQRVLDTPLRVRFHYGHPDLFDKLFFMSRGGVSKASKGINLSEDIFAGFNSVLRGGSVQFKEYIQVGKGRDVGLQQLFKFEAKLSQGNAMQSISRDVYRLANTLDFFRLLSFFFGGVGFYIANCLTICALYVFIYSRLILASFRLESLDSFSGADTISYWFGMIGFLLTLPVLATIGLERGFRKAFLEVFRMVVTGGSFYYLFMMGTKDYFFSQTMLAGGAKYRPTGRGFVTRHEHFAEIYRFHASSHFYRSVEMLLALLLYSLVIPPTYSYGLVTWAGWLIVISWLCGPFWFNPLAFEWEKTVQDWVDFERWMQRREGDGDRSWRAWWKDENSFLSGLPLSTRIGLALLQLRYVVVAVALIYFMGARQHQVIIAALLLAAFLLGVVFVRARQSLAHQFVARLLKAALVLLALVGFLSLVFVENLSAGEWMQYAMSLVSLTYLFHALCNMALVLGLRTHFLQQWFKLVDWTIATGIFVVLGLLSVTIIPSMIQTRLMFHNAFSRGVLIDKLLKSKPDDDGAAKASAAPVVKQDRTGSGKVGGGGGGGNGGSRRRDARQGRDDDRGDSPEPSPESGSTHGFDLQSISFIEKRSTVPKKKLHPSKSQGGDAHAQDEPASSRGGEKRGGKGNNVSFGGSSSSSASASSSGMMGSSHSSGLPPRKTPSITNMGLVIQEESPDYTPSPHLLPSVGPSPGGLSPSVHLPVSALMGRPIPSSGVSLSGAGGAGGAGGSPSVTGSLPLRGSILSSMGGARASSDGAALSPSAVPGSAAAASGASAAPAGVSPGGQSMPFPPTVQVVPSALQGQRQGSGSYYTHSPVAPQGLPSSGSQGSVHSSTAGSPRTASPAPGSPSLVGLAGSRSRNDRLVGLAAPLAAGDERPIPKTIAPTDASKAISIAKSPLNPRRG